MSKTVLGKEYKDVVTGFTGIAIACHTYLQGCDRIAIQPPVDDKGEIKSHETFDEPSLVLVSDGIVDTLAPAGVRSATGGPDKYTDSRRV